MSDTFDKIMQFAAKSSNAIAEKFHMKKGDDMDKENMNIESYDGQDAFYTGTDEEYEEFLKNADIKIDEIENAKPVSDTQRINLSETINIQSVIEKFKKTAGGIESGAKKLKDTVISKVDEFKAKKEASEVDETEDVFAEDITEEIEKTSFSEKIKSAVKTSVEKIDEFKDSVLPSSDEPDKIEALETKLQDVCGDIADINKKLDEISEKLKVMEVQDNERSKDSEQSRSAIKQYINDMSNDVLEIKQSVNAVSKLSDSVFDLKNTQLNTKNVVSDLEVGFARLKKKCVLGVTILSILSAIIIVLEIILMLS